MKNKIKAIDTPISNEEIFRKRFNTQSGVDAS